MQDTTRMKYLKIALQVFGVIYIAGVYLMMRWIFPEGWSWNPANAAYENMILGVYAVLGIFLFLAAKDPVRDSSLIWFTIWSNIVHAGVMLYYAIINEAERPNISPLGDVPALFLVAGVLWFLMPKKSG